MNRPIPMPEEPKMEWTPLASSTLTSADGSDIFAERAFCAASWSDISPGVTRITTGAAAATAPEIANRNVMVIFILSPKKA